MWCLTSCPAPTRRSRISQRSTISLKSQLGAGRRQCIRNIGRNWLQCLRLGRNNYWRLQIGSLFISECSDEAMKHSQICRYLCFSGGNMKVRWIILLVALAALMSGIQLYAHHSFAATYFEDKQQTVEGDLVQFLFRNPHSFVHVEGKDEKGETVRWAIEWGGGGQLGRQGVTRETLKPGDHVIIVGNPGRNPDDHRLRMLRLKRTSDGWIWGGRPGESFD